MINSVIMIVKTRCKEVLDFRSDVIPGNDNNNNKKTAVDELAMQETVY